jgi:hypothetical protein
MPEPKRERQNDHSKKTDKTAIMFRMDLTLFQKTFLSFIHAPSFFNVIMFQSKFPANTMFSPAFLRGSRSIQAYVLMGYPHPISPPSVS